ncbi:unnamed protein product [Prunus armeniaca]
MEILAIRQAFSVCVQTQLTSPMVESDAHRGISILNVQIAADVDLEGIFFDIHQLMSQLTRVTFVFAPRHCNSDAHVVARFVYRHGVNHVRDYSGY